MATQVNAMCKEGVNFTSDTIIYLFQICRLFTTLYLIFLSTIYNIMSYISDLSTIYNIMSYISDLSTIYNIMSYISDLSTIYN